jgi:hypothetical protein
MIVALSAIAVAGGLLVGRWVAARHQKALPAPAPPEPVPQSAADDARARDEASMEDEQSGQAGHADHTARPEEAVDWSAFPCALGDVVMRTLDGAEAWLGGAIVLLEDAPAAVLFVAPDAAGERAIYARPRPSVELAWLMPVRRDALTVGAEPPSAIEIDGVRFERRRRLPLRAQRVGTGAPDVGGTTIVGEYGAASGEVAIVLVAEGVARAWRGRRLEEGEYEVWSGEKTRE